MAVVVAVVVAGTVLSDDAAYDSWAFVVGACHAVASFVLDAWDRPDPSCAVVAVDWAASSCHFRVVAAFQAVEDCSFVRSDPSSSVHLSAVAASSSLAAVVVVVAAAVAAVVV